VKLRDLYFVVTPLPWAAAANQQQNNTMDTVFIRDLRIDTVIGIYDWEREIRQTVVFDLEMGADIARAAATDAIEDTLDYKAVSKRLIEFVRESEFQLVETLAERCAAIVLDEFEVPWVRLTLNKAGAVSAARDVGVIIERARRG
jgi:dihydroneopterin aldolase